MTKLDDLRLSDLLPSSIKDDREIAAMASAFDKELQAITACINEIILLPNIDNLPEDIIDSLAWQFHVDFYEPLGLDLSKRRALVKNSLSWHRRKGTKSVLEEVIRILFLEDFKIEEWFEYGGEPYFFRFIVNKSIESKEKYENLIRAIYELKNTRSWLEEIRVILTTEMTYYPVIFSDYETNYFIDNSIQLDFSVEYKQFATYVLEDAKEYEIRNIVDGNYNIHTYQFRGIALETYRECYCGNSEEVF